MLVIPEVIIGMYHECTEGVWGWTRMKSFRLAGIIFLKELFIYNKPSGCQTSAVTLEMEKLVITAALELAPMCVPEPDLLVHTNWYTYFYIMHNIPALFLLPGSLRLDLRFELVYFI